MTISTTQSNQGFVGDGVITVFAVTYVVLAESHIKVYLDNVLQVSGYTVTLNPDQETTPGADVTFAVAPANGVAVNALRVVPYTQETDYQPFDAFPAESHETALDLLTMQTQQIAEAIGRTPQLPVDTPLDGYDLGTPVPNRVIQYKADGTGQESTGIDATAFNSNVAAAAAAASAASASANRAQEWAENPEDVPVIPGEFSAFHWAQKSQAFTNWDQYLDGYDAASRRHTEYAGDLDAVLINSKYFVDSTAITNEPAGFVGLGVVETNMWDTNTDQAVQLLVSMDIVNNGASWIRAREGGAWQAWKPFGAGGTTVSDTPPDSPSVGDGWWDSETGNAYVYYDDGDSQQWVQEDPIGDPVEHLPGSVVQVVTIERSDSFNLTGTIPTDNSKPQITEGTEFFSQAFTPKYASSILQIEVLAHTVSQVLATTNTIALFQDAIADALATAAISQPVVGYLTQQVLRASFPAGSTAARTYSMRGAVNAGGGSLWLNSGGPSTPLWDGTLFSSMTITEIRQ